MALFRKKKKEETVDLDPPKPDVKLIEPFEINITDLVEKHLDIKEDGVSFHVEVSQEHIQTHESEYIGGKEKIKNVYWKVETRRKLSSRYGGEQLYISTFYWESIASCDVYDLLSYHTVDKKLTHSQMKKFVIDIEKKIESEGE